MYNGWLRERESLSVCVCVCVCVREGEREREREKGREGERWRGPSRANNASHNEATTSSATTMMMMCMLLCFDTEPFCIALAALKLTSGASMHVCCKRSEGESQLCVCVCVCVSVREREKERERERENGKLWKSQVMMKIFHQVPTPNMKQIVRSSSLHRFADEDPFNLSYVSLNSLATRWAFG